MKALTGPYRRNKGELSNILEQLLDEGRVFRFAPYRGKVPRYWDRPVETYASGLIEQQLRKGPRSLAAIDQAIRKPLRDTTTTWRRQVLERLVSDGTIYKLPPLPRSGAHRYSVTSPEPGDYLRVMPPPGRRLPETPHQTPG